MILEYWSTGMFLRSSKTPVLEDPQADDATSEYLE